jgi:S1-C subfamily serine protease
MPFRNSWLVVAPLMVLVLIALGIGVFLAFGADPTDETLTEQELALVKAAELARVEVIDKVYGAVVAVYGNDRSGGGSGVLFDEAGYALTNHHVIAGAGVEGWGGLADGKLYRWKLIGTDPGGDIAVIRLEGKDRFPAAPLGDSDVVRVGDFAMAMGNPFTLAEDQKPTVTLGIVSGVERYQHGAGLNELVYGNCIQVDSSINPGNSGGPLFNMRGEVIGINGRGSFEERGRVNVGLGYAVSINQIKRFIPDLLATKLAQHGTLDAIFTNREAGVICSTINLDSPVAKAGLDLGDRLIAFEGRPITDANAFTNLISTLPADWPVELVFEHEGERRTAHVRLLPLPYNIQQPQEEMPPEPDGKPEPEKKPDPEDPEKKDGGEKPADEKPAPEAEKPASDATAEEEKPAEPKADEKRDEPKPDESKEDKPEEPKRIEIKPPQRKQADIGTPGQVRDEALNQAAAKHLAERWKQTIIGELPFSDARLCWEINDRVLKMGEAVGSQRIVLDDQGRFRVEYTEGDRQELFGYDGKQFWKQSPGGKSETLALDKALLVPQIGQAAPLAQVFRQEPLADFGSVKLEGSDEAQSRDAYRLKTLDAGGDWFYLWLAVEPTPAENDSEPAPPFVLLKAGPELDARPPDHSIVYRDWRLVGGLRLPHRRAFVSGMGETIVAELIADSIASRETNDDDFRIPE